MFVPKPTSREFLFSGVQHFWLGRLVLRGALVSPPHAAAELSRRAARLTSPPRPPAACPRSPCVLHCTPVEAQSSHPVSPAPRSPVSGAPVSRVPSDGRHGERAKRRAGRVDVHTSFCMFTDAPATSSLSTITMWPFSAAQISGVQPSCRPAPTQPSAGAE